MVKQPERRHADPSLAPQRRETSNRSILKHELRVNWAGGGADGAGLSSH